MPSHVGQNELSMEEQLSMALTEYQNPENVKLKRKIAQEHGIYPLTFQGRVGMKNTAACGSKKEQEQKWQWLSPEEENALIEWALQIEAWGWSPWCIQLRFMAKELLHLKGDLADLEVNWNQKFLSCHLNLEKRYTRSIDKEWAMMHDKKKIKVWFKLFEKNCKACNIQLKNLYNIDEKRFAISIISSIAVIYLKHERSKKINII